MMRAIVLGWLSLTLGFAAGDPLAASCREKIDEIESGHAKANAIYELSAAEINAYTREELPQTVPQGLRSPSVELGPNTAIGSALIDFLQMQQAKGVKMNWLIERFIEGERPVRVTIESETKDGRAIIRLRRFEISGIAANSIVLDFLIRNFFRPLYPDAHINEWFDMGYNIDHVDVTSASVRVYIKSKLAKLPPKPPSKRPSPPSNRL
jgi:hypothetical protein